jgi:hypothetical protein
MRDRLPVSPLFHEQTRTERNGTRNHEPISSTAQWEPWSGAPPSVHSHVVSSLRNVHMQILTTTILRYDSIITPINEFG